MASLILVCHRDVSDSNLSVDDVMLAGRLLIPDDITVDPAWTLIEQPLIASVINPPERLTSAERAVCLGKMYGPQGNWSKVHSEPPDGSYAILRFDNRWLEILSDVIASRTVWYYFDHQSFIASTSQRAIVALLRNFKLNRAAVTWMLSSGTLGPSASWDRRIERLQGNSRLELDRAKWQIKVRRAPIAFAARSASLADFRAELCRGIRSTCAAFGDCSDWYLPLSGGYDSRALLLYLLENQPVRCVTWGVQSALKQRGTDAYVATRLARKLGVDHQYFCTDVQSEDPQLVLERFVHVGEGRVDHLSGYLDGFKTWTTLFNNGVRGIIRGDSGFGWQSVGTDVDVRRMVGALTMADHFPEEQLESFDLPPQHWPEELTRSSDESLATWADRLAFEYRTPTVKAALNDLKSHHVEVASPLLARCVIKVVAQMPDSLRKNKCLFRSLVRQLGPRIPFAKADAIARLGEVVGTRCYLESVQRELTSTSAETVLSGRLLRHILDQVATPGNPASHSRITKQQLKRFLPGRVITVLRRVAPRQKLGPAQLAFRAYIACRMARLLASDAAIGAHSGMQTNRSVVTSLRGQTFGRGVNAQVTHIVDRRVNGQNEPMVRKGYYGDT